MRKRIVIAAFIVALLAVGAAATTLLLPHLLEGAGQQTQPEGQTAGQEEGGEDEPIVQDEPARAVTMAEAPVRTSTTDDGVTVTAPDAFLTYPELAEVTEQIGALREQGYSVCVALVDLESRRGIWYNADAVMYPASSIKASYCTWIYETNGGAGSMSGTVADCLINSSNDAYHALLDTYGLSAYASWLTANGAPEAAKKGGVYYYPETTANELASIWEEIYRYGTSGEAGSDELAGFLAQTNRSPIGEQLRGTYEVWSKPGWYPADGNGLGSSNDAGVVFSDTGDYVMVIMTDISSNLDALTPLVDALDAAHEAMCGDDIAYYED